MAARVTVVQATVNRLLKVTDNNTPRLRANILSTASIRPSTSNTLLNMADTISRHPANTPLLPSRATASLLLLSIMASRLPPSTAAATTKRRPTARLRRVNTALLPLTRRLRRRLRSATVLRR